MKYLKCVGKRKVGSKTIYNLFNQSTRRIEYQLDGEKLKELLADTDNYDIINLNISNSGSICAQNPVDDDFIQQILFNIDTGLDKIENKIRISGKALSYRWALHKISCVIEDRSDDANIRFSDFKYIVRVSDGKTPVIYELEYNFCKDMYILYKNKPKRELNGENGKRNCGVMKFNNLGDCFRWVVNDIGCMYFNS